MTQLILYSKPGCHLCEGLQEKLAQVTQFDFELEIRDIKPIILGLMHINTKSPYFAKK